jgi:hypothetical protein
VLIQEEDADGRAGGPKFGNSRNKAIALAFGMFYNTGLPGPAFQHRLEGCGRGGLGGDVRAEISPQLHRLVVPAGTFGRCDGSCDTGERVAGLGATPVVASCWLAVA